VEERGKVAAKRPWKESEEAIRPASIVFAVKWRARVERSAQRTSWRGEREGSRLTIQLERQHGRVKEDVGTPGTLVGALEAEEVGTVPHLIGQLEEEGRVWWILLAVGLEDLMRVGLDGVHEEVCR